ncbi:MAG: hypothetical protein HGA87_07050, partial [Desulfobulbaceae bacterium]|nr:hypothetical protein [Desulfobulbaceae bacterium]
MNRNCYFFHASCISKKCEEGHRKFLASRLMLLENRHAFGYSSFCFDQGQKNMDKHFPLLEIIRCSMVVLIVLILCTCGGGGGGGGGSADTSSSGGVTASSGTALGINGANEVEKNAGSWSATIITPATSLQSGQSISVTVDLTLISGVVEALLRKNNKLDKIVLLLTAERMFDGNGWQHRHSDEGMSTILTPTGVPIFGGSHGAISPRFNNYPFRTPIDELVELPLPGIANPQTIHFQLNARVMQGIPPGLYRLRANFGVRANYSSTSNPNNYYYYDLHYSNFTRHTFHDGSYAYSSPLLPARGTDASGQYIDATALKASLPGVMLTGYNSNGYSGVVCDEDSTRFALGQFSIMHDEIVLPKVSPAGYSYSYNLEPFFPFEYTFYPRDNIDWDWTKGALSYEITNPDGTLTSQPATPIVGKSASRIGPTTNNTAFTSWRPPMYGQYKVKLTGWMQDKNGRRYEGGGTYQFWIARRLTMATATFQGMAYPVGSSYGR